MADESVDRAMAKDGRRLRAKLVAVPGVVELEAEGFTAIETLMGNHELALSWPKDHVRSIRDTRYRVELGGWPEAELAVVEQFFRQGEKWVRAYERGRVNRLA